MLKAYLLSAAFLVASSFSPIQTQAPVIEAVVAQAVVAQSPVQTIVQPTVLTVKPGKLVRLDFGMAEGEVVTWWLPGGDKELYTIENKGQTCLFSHVVPGVYPFVRISSRLDDDVIVQSVTEHVVTISGTPPVNPDPPKPPVVVDPIVPSSKSFGMADFTKNLIKANAAVLDLKMCPEFSGNWGAVVTQITDRKLTTWEQASGAIKDLNRASYPKTVAGWNESGPIGKAMNTQIANLIKNGSFSNTDMTEVAKLFSEIRDGFAAAR